MLPLQKNHYIYHSKPVFPIIPLNTEYEEANMTLRTLLILNSGLRGSQVLSGRQSIVATKDDDKLNSANQCQDPAGSSS